MILSDNRIDNLHYQLRSDLIDYTISNTFTILDLLIEYNISIRNDKNDILNRIQNNIIDEDFTIFNNIHMFCILIELSFNDSLTFNNRLPKADILFYRFVIMLGSKEPKIYIPLLDKFKTLRDIFKMKNHNTGITSQDKTILKQIIQESNIFFNNIFNGKYDLIISNQISEKMLQMLKFIINKLLPNNADEFNVNNQKGGNKNNLNYFIEKNIYYITITQ
jgi:hypothetical protein